MQKFIFIFIFLILIFSSFVLGLGVSPGKIEFDFTPNTQYNFEMKIYNTPIPIDRLVEIYVSFSKLDSDLVSEFENILELETADLIFTENDDIKSLNVNVNMPEGFSTAGAHELRIGALQKSSGEGDGLSVVAGNEIKVLINVDSEDASDKFARIRKIIILNINGEDVEKNQISDINIKIKSESNVELNDVFAVVNVSKSGRLLESLVSESVDIRPNEEKTLNTEFKADVDIGILTLNVQVFYYNKAVSGKGSLKVLEAVSSESEEEFGFKISYFWIILIVIFLLVIIILLLIFLLKRKNQNEQQIQN